MVENDDLKLNESGGRLFEFLTKIVLQSLFPNFRIEWQPQGVADVIIQPDLAVYSPDNKLLAIGFCAHATAVNAAGMKVERSVEELFEVKETHTNVLALSFIWHSPNGWAKSQLRTMDSAFDYSFVAYRECHDSWNSLVEKMIDTAPKMRGKDDVECEKIVYDSGLVESLIPYFCPLKMLMENGEEHNGSLWNLSRKRYQGLSQPKARVVRQPIKAALIPLLWVPDVDLDTILGCEGIRKEEKYEAFLRLGGGRLDVSGRIHKSESVRYLASHYPRGVVVNTIKHLRNAEGITSLINSIGSKQALDRRISRIVSAISNGKLFELCRESEQKIDEDYTGNSWVLAICAEWIKARVDQKFGLFEAQRKSLGEIDNRFKTEFRIINYLDGEFSVFDDSELSSICRYLSGLLVGKRSITALELSSALKTETLKKKKHNPLHWLMEETLTAYKVPYLHGYSLRSVFSDAAPTTGNGGVSTFQLYLKQNNKTIIIHALSTYSSTHKDVEMSAKSRLLHYVRKVDVFRYRNDPEFVFVLDGMWPTRSVPMLERSGARVIPIVEFPRFVKKLSEKMGINQKSEFAKVLPKLSRKDADELLEAAEETKRYGKSS